MMNPSLFKAYDIRGIYPTEVDEDAAYNIGRATVDYFDAHTIAVGRDIRSHSQALFDALTRGITEGGCDVIDLGLLTTPMVYFAAWKIEGVDAVISVTASHNPPEYNGFKLALRGAIPVGENSGLMGIRELALADNFTPKAKIGAIAPYDIKSEYYDHFCSFARFTPDKKFKIVIDTANTMGVLELPIFERFKDNLDITYLYNDLKHPFTAHEANPLKTETLADLQAKVIEAGADLGIAFDGDADRVGFVDEKGQVIPMDLVTGLLAKEVLRQNPGATILYDLRSSKAVKEFIEENGGHALECKVGHANIKQQMRTDGAVFAGELSGHYYFLENSYAEAGSLPALMLLNLMSTSDQPISTFIQGLRRYHHSGEINSTVPDPSKMVAALREKYSDGKWSELDGLKVTYPNWWFNVRPSNTEPVLRLNLEADTEDLMIQKRDELLSLIRK